MAIKRKGNLTKEKILHFAKDAFYQNGYHATQLKSIAALADLSLGNLNYYFKKKDDLVEEIYRQFFTDIYHFIKKSAVINPLEQFCLFQFMAVSYTHLDVYKRQGQKNGLNAHILQKTDITVAKGDDFLILPFSVGHAFRCV